MHSRIGGAEDSISLLSLAWFRRLHFQATHPFTEARMSVQGYDPVAIGLALFPSLSSQAKA